MICWFGLLSGLAAASGLYGTAYHYGKRRDGSFTPSLRFAVVLVAVFFLVWFAVAAARHVNDSFLSVGFFEIPSVLGRCPGPGAVPALAEGYKITDPLRIIAYTVGLTSGFLTLLSPCGLPVLPAYIPYFLGKKPSVRRGIYGGSIALGGIAVTVIGLAIVISSTTGFLATTFLSHQNFDLIAGTALIVLGLATALKFHLPIMPNMQSIAKKGNLGLFAFGASWSGVSLTCSAPLFLSFAIFIVALDPSILVPAFASYALGMGIPVLIISAALGGAGTIFLRKIVLFAPRLQRYSGVLLLGVGIYVLADTGILLKLLQLQSL